MIILLKDIGIFSSSWCIMTVTVVIMRLFLAVLWVGLSCMIVVIPDHTHFFIIEVFECLSALGKVKNIRRHN